MRGDGEPHAAPHTASVFLLTSLGGDVRMRSRKRTEGKTKQEGQRSTEDAQGTTEGENQGPKPTECHSPLKSGELTGPPSYVRIPN